MIGHCEDVVRELEMNKDKAPFMRAPVMRTDKRCGWLLPLGTLRRKIAKAFYFLIFDRTEFRSRFAAYRNLRKQSTAASSKTPPRETPVRSRLKRAATRSLAYKLTVFSDKYNMRPAEYVGNGELLDEFIACCRAMHKPRVLELGTKRSIPERSTRHCAGSAEIGQRPFLRCS